uniref:Uncharacterized protein n=1 Tax=Oryza glumipatula TaxID=40148 RepID=A0A0D9YT53_9ORYZ
MMRSEEAEDGDRCPVGGRAPNTHKAREKSHPHPHPPHKRIDAESQSALDFVVPRPRGIGTQLVSWLRVSFLMMRRPRRLHSSSAT